MGQAKNRGSKDERIAQAITLAHRANDAPSNRPRRMPRTLLEAKELDAELAPLFAGLTTPTEVNAQVAEFARTLSDREPMFLKCVPELWSRQDCCDLNVAKYVDAHGGQMICGYRIWYTEPLYIEGERHAVWTNGKEFRDVSFVVSGEAETLFVPDDKAFGDAPIKVRHAFRSRDKEALSVHEHMERLQPPIARSSEGVWEQMLTYEEWLAGKRGASMFLAMP